MGSNPAGSSQTKKTNSEKGQRVPSDPLTEEREEHSKLLRESIVSTDFVKKIIPRLLEIEQDLARHKDYWEKYTNIAKNCMSLLGSPMQVVVNQYVTQDKLVLWTDHGADHAFSVLKTVNELYDSFREAWNLNDYERFVLLSSCWCHDLGMFLPNPNLSLSQQREYHGQISGTVLISMSALFSYGLNEQEALSIALVCAAHEKKFKLNPLVGFPANIKDPVRLDLLGTTLRIADALDISKYRAKDMFFEAFEAIYGKLSSTSIFEWNVNRCIHSRKIQENTIEYELEMDEFLKQRLSEMKNEIWAKRNSDPGGTRRSRREWTNRLNEYYSEMAKYISFHISDHLLSVDQAGDETNKFIEDLVKWKIKVSFQSTSTPTKQRWSNDKIEAEIRDGIVISSVVEERRKYYKQLKRRHFWMPSAHVDRDVKDAMQNIQEFIRKDVLKKVSQNKSDDMKPEEKEAIEEAIDVFLFLFDAEHDTLTLWAPEDFYKRYRKKGQDPKSLCRKLRKVRIPLKCGIVGYAAWTGEDEIVFDEDTDPRPSYGDIDIQLKLTNIIFSNIEKDKDDQHDKDDGNKYLLGVFLINFEEDTYANMFIDVCRPLPSLKELLGSDLYDSLIQALEKHCVSAG